MPSKTRKKPNPKYHKQRDSRNAFLVYNGTPKEVFKENPNWMYMQLGLKLRKYYERLRCEGKLPVLWEEKEEELSGTIQSRVYTRGT